MPTVVEARRGITRLEALWRAWQHLRLDAHTGMSVWFRDHADHQMAVLLSADGPYKAGKPAGHGRAAQTATAHWPTRRPRDAEVTAAGAQDGCP